MKVGIIGTGICRMHANGFKKCEDVEIKTVCDVNTERAEKFAKDYDVKNICSDYHELFADPEIEAVTVGVPNALHAPVVIAAFEAGKHVMCEKPISTCAEDARKMVEAGKKSGKIFMMGFNNRFRGDTQLLKKCIENGDLGDIYYAKTGWLRRKGIPGMGGWFTTKALSGGGPLIDLGVHVLDLALWLMGNPKPVYVMGSSYAKFGPEIAEKNGGTYDVEDLATGMVKLENGATVFVEASWASHVENERIYTQLIGTKGGAEVDPLKIYTDINGSTANIEMSYPNVSGHEMEIVHFVECIRQNKTPIATGEHGLHIQLILDAIYESTVTGKGVEI
ncbi:Gfo/Idh/MocA family oxidoreductase [bacterium]|nr:Gfo/Idh/MocA family oxidoreductase [bacterium]